jgi:hypothetical protein
MKSEVVILKADAETVQMLETMGNRGWQHLPKESNAEFKRNLYRASIALLLISTVLLGFKLEESRIELQHANQTIATWQRSAQNWHDHFARQAAPEEKTRN